MLKPLFVEGKEMEQNLLVGSAVGDDFLRCSHSENFAIGDRMFVGETNGSDLEYAGIATLVGVVPWVQTNLTLQRAKTTPATIWRAKSFFQWDCVSVETVHRVFHEGIMVERAIGGELWSVRVADPAREDTLRFAGVSRASFAAFRQWLKTGLNGGTKEFAWVDEERLVARVRLLGCDLAQVSRDPRALTVDLKLAVLGEGEYA